MSPAGIVISAKILDAYRRTDYVVLSADGPVVLRIGEASVALRELHWSMSVTSSVFVTACNPFGQRWSDLENAAANERLRAFFDDRAIHWIAGEGRGEKDDWLPEASVLALGVPADAAPALCVEFQQNAVVAIDDDAVPRLVFHPRAVLVQDA